MSNPSSIKRRINWAKYTDFRSRHSKDHLVRICARLESRKLEEVFRTFDETGLCPIHWAAINNRSDLIEFMAEKGSPLRIKCRNKLLADGSPLHLAAMNGSLEAVSMLMLKDQTTYRSSFPLLTERDGKAAPSNEQSNLGDWLNELDAEGQSPLMRSAAPRSKRMDLFRDLLRKNTWSLSARPSEMALYLINKGANWRLKEPKFSMNLFHLAIANDYDDIVNLLIVIDKSVLKIPAKMSQGSAIDANNNSDIKLDFEEHSPEENGQVVKQPLISRQEVAEDLLAKGLSPLQLAIVYGRLGIICLLWDYYRQKDRPKGSLRDTLLTVALTNRREMIRLMRGAFLKMLLILDISITLMLWVPVYLPSSNDDGKRVDLRAGTFLLSFFICLALCFRVAMRDPGYLPRDSQLYFKGVSELSRVSVLTKSRSTSSNQADDDQVLLQGDIESRVRLLCHRCRTIRRSRTRHCSSCNRCVQDFDHHCIYLNCCIGRGNRLDFLLLLILTSITAINGLTIQGRYTDHDQWSPFWYFVGFIWILKYAFISTLSAFCTLRRACLGITMYEEIRSNTIKRIFGPKGTPSDINKTHRVFSTSNNTIWRYSPSKYPTSGQSIKKMFGNLIEFVNLSNPLDYILQLFCPDAQMSHSLVSNI